MSNKQSSIEWLIEQVINNNGVNKSTFQQAKAMHKEEVMEFGYSAVRKILDENRQNPFNLEQYYNETFKNK